MVPASHRFGDESFVGGGQIGYNYQAGAFVLGAEADISAMGANRSSQTTGITTADVPIVGSGGANFEPGNQFNSTATLSMDWVSTLRGRLGLADDRVLVFATGGVAWSDIDLAGSVTHQFPVGGPVLDAWSGSSSDHVGYVFGGGVEYAFTNTWILRLEALHYDFGQKVDQLTPTVTSGPLTDFLFTRSTDLEMTTVRGGINYKF